MKKTELLRGALIAGNEWCRARPEQITVWTEKGAIEIQATGESSFLYRYEIKVLAMEYPGHVDDLMLPLLAWVWRHQPDLLLNPDSNRKIEFEADILSDDAADILFTLPVWERVMVSNESGVAVATHLPEDRPRFCHGEWDAVFLDPDAGEVMP